MKQNIKTQVNDAVSYYLEALEWDNIAKQAYNAATSNVRTAVWFNVKNAVANPVRGQALNQIRDHLLKFNS